MKKEKAIIVFKTKQSLTPHLEKKLSNSFLFVMSIYLDDFKNYTLNNIVKKINKLINEYAIDCAFFEGDYLSLINYNFIQHINVNFKILMCFDDFDMHDVNSITGKACDHIITACPISNLKFLEKQFSSFYCPLEGDQSFYKKIDLEKKYDVFFFGMIKHDRKNFLDAIKKNKINLKVVGHNINKVSEETIVQLINESKIVINFSKTGFRRKEYSLKTINYDYYQFKGRIVIAGLCGTLCISEFAPANKLLFDQNELLEFNNSEEMINILSKILNNNELYNELTLKFIEKAKKYSDKLIFPKIFDQIGRRCSRSILKNLPFFYERAFNNQRIRYYKKNQNIKLFLLDLFENIFERIKKISINNLVLIIESIISAPLMIVNIFYKKIKKNVSR